MITFVILFLLAASGNDTAAEERYVIELTAPPAAEAAARAEPAAEKAAALEKARAVALYQQQRVRAELAKWKARVITVTVNLTNTITVEASPAAIAAIETMPEVRSVQPVRVRKTPDSSPRRRWASVAELYTETAC